MIISCLSQKGGVGKSSVARTLAVEFTRAGWNTLLADIDNSQATSQRWVSKRREVAGIKPDINTSVFPVTGQALKASNDYELTIIDGAPHSTSGTLEAANSSDLVILPSGTSVDDLEAQLGLAVELRDKAPNSKIIFVVYLASSDAQAREAKDTINATGFSVLNTHILHLTSYVKAFDIGHCATETKYKSLNKKASLLIKEIAELLQESN